MIPFIDLSRQQSRIRAGIEKRIHQVLDHGNYIMGPEIQELENALSQFTGSRYALSCASGTDALLIALMAYNIGPGDAVLTTPFTFIATAEVIALLGATPVFVDIDPHSFNIAPQDLTKALQALSRRDASLYPLPAGIFEKEIVPKAIIAVDLFGLPADYSEINAIAREHGLFVIEDAAQAFGAEYDGKRAGSLAHVGCTSFFPAKPLGCYGDGGMCFTDDDALADIMRSLRVHGKGGHKYDNVRIGINGRLDTLQAAILLEKFSIYAEELQLRQKVARIYDELLYTCTGLSLPFVPANKMSSWAQYSVVAPDEILRQALIDGLKAKGIPTAVYYPKPLHLQSAFLNLRYKDGDFAVSESIARKIVSLPFYPYLEQSTQMQIAEIIHVILNRAL